MTRASVVGLVGAVLLLLLFAVQTERADRARVAVSDEALVADTVAASRDTTRELAVRIGKVQDSLRVVQRRVVQVGQEKDRLDRTLKLERAARESLVTVIAEYHAMIVADSGGRDVGTTADSGDSIRRATFEMRQTPYSVHAQVALPEASGQGTITLDVVLDTLRLEARLGCGPPNAVGVRPAALSITAPSWAQVQIARVEDDPSVCTGLGGGGRMAWMRSVASRVGISVGYGVVGATGNALTAGVGVMIGVRVWP